MGCCVGTTGAPLHYLHMCFRRAVPFRIHNTDRGKDREGVYLHNLSGIVSIELRQAVNLADIFILLQVITYSV